MDRDEALEKLRNIMEDCKTSYLPLPVSIGEALVPILAALSSPCACGDRKLIQVRNIDLDGIILSWVVERMIDYDGSFDILILEGEP